MYDWKKVKLTQSGISWYYQHTSASLRLEINSNMVFYVSKEGFDRMTLLKSDTLAYVGNFDKRFIMEQK